MYNTKKNPPTIFQNLEEMKEVDSVSSGYGEGSFVVVRGTKPLVLQEDS